MRTLPTLIGAAAVLILLPFAVPLVGLTSSTATQIVVLMIAALGLNMMMGYTGLVSFGHGVWFGIGAYVAALAQKHLFAGQILLPILTGLIFVGLLSLIIGALILRRRGVYFALMTLALSALTFSIAFRWTAVTGGEDGLGGFNRATALPIDLSDNLTYYYFTAALGLAVLYLLIRVVRSPFGHVLVAIRENQTRAEFQGYPVQRYKLAVFVLSALVTGLGGILSGFQHYIVTAESTSIEFSGELLAMVVIGGMRGSILGPAVGVLFFVLFREVLSIWTSDWLFWFGLVFVAFVMYLPGGIIGIVEKVRHRLNPPPDTNAAMSNRKIYQGLDLPVSLRPEPSSRSKVLVARGVSKNFGGIKAVREADVAVSPGQIHALIGPNGAGKTTLFNLISGGHTPTGGSIELMGQPIAGLSPDAISQAGLARSFQITSLFEQISIRENLRLSFQAKHPGRFNFWRDIDSFDDINAETAELIRFLGLEGIEDTNGADLSYGGQRLVDLGIALATKPQMLLLDEPLAGLAAAERERVSKLVTTMAQYIPVLIVEHDIDRILGFSDVVTVMNDGAVLLSGTPETIRSDRRVQEIYTGTGTPTVTSGKGAQDAVGPVVLRVEGLHSYYGKSHILNGAALEVREGEIVALLGRNGAGKSTFLKSLSGLVKPRGGSIDFAGQDILGLGAPDIARAGIGYVPQGRGLFSGMTVRDNLALGRLARPQGQGGVYWTEDRIFEFFPRLAERIDSHADFLSGGEQQMLAIARALSADVRLLLLDEPFEGLAPAVIEDLFRVLDQLRVEVPVIIVEHNLDLVLALADRVYAMEQGAVFHEGPAAALLHDLDYRKKILWL
ncbi:branched-chain amino acid ABC transporter ATP-binding protein/permease [Puniceibacterium sediminis]|uniref:Amino acid/amide ABC transporter membrane protein 2, HAAT family n=1 Tax=Puniceibacterium sediminis TaxID=1608407 RepID=A0A238X948_9RHOB|nr:branched-chain amino acid ABC transporter ATP-binding protein/permease [Puniceibacterium sediminis]SNR54379.1 amino acid/amide ABC transporter membrane protein 2, HAAT family [Puniceibacterium sediminis]